MRPTEEDLRRDLAADLALCDAATPGPWYTVGPPWRPSGCPSYIIAGHHDPHIGKPVLDAIDVDEWDAEQDGPDYSQSDADMAFAAAARTGWPAAIRIAEHYRRQFAMADAQCKHLARELGRAETENAALRAQIAGHCERIAAQSELLSRRPEKPEADLCTERDGPYE